MILPLMVLQVLIPEYGIMDAPFLPIETLNDGVESAVVPIAGAHEALEVSEILITPPMG